MSASEGRRPPAHIEEHWGVERESTPAEAVWHLGEALRISACLIAKNERKNVRSCLGSFWDHVDEVVFVDTGSRDGTVAEVQRFASEQRDPGKLVLGRFKWCDDFAAARNYAHSLATGAVHMTVDLDDLVIGGEHLCDAAQQFADDGGLGAVAALWSGPISAQEWRPRLWRPDAHWTNRAMEVPVFRGKLACTFQIRWQHKREISHGRRDLDIGLKWAKDEPRNWRALLLTVLEAAEVEDWALVSDYCARGLSLARLPTRRRGEFLVYKAQAKAQAGDFAGAGRIAREAIRCSPSTDARPWLLRASCAFECARHAEALRCAEKAGKLAVTEELRRSAIALSAEIAMASARSTGADGRAAGLCQGIRADCQWPRSEILQLGFSGGSYALAQGHRSAASR